MKRSYILYFSILLFLISFVSYEIVFPYQLSRKYRTELDIRTADLQKKLTYLSQSANNTVLGNEDLSYDSKKLSLKQIYEQIEQTKQDISSYTYYASQLRHLPNSGYISSYSKATTLKDGANKLAIQTTEVIDEYEDLISYFGKYIDIENEYQSILDKVNSSSDLTSLNADAIFSDEKRLSELSGKLNQTEHPEVLNESNYKLVENIKKSSYGLNILGTGLIINSEYMMDSGIKLIENSTNEYYSIIKPGIYEKIPRSPVIQNSKELPSKTSIIYN